MKKAILCFIPLLTCSLGMQAEGLWKAYLAYANIQDIQQASGNIIYVQASNGLYAYNQNDKSIQTFDKTNVLSDCNIEHIGWNNATKQLLIIYADDNFDLLSQNGNVTNVPDYMNTTTTMDKTVNDIYMQANYAYISTGFGVMKMDMTDAAIDDTYNLGFSVNYVYIQHDSIFAASQKQGIYAAPLQANLVDKSSWTRVSNYVKQQKTLDPDLLAIVKTLSPGGPRYNNFAFMRFTQNRLYTVGGGVDANPATPQVLSGDNWQIYEDSLSAKTGVKYLGAFTIEPNPKNPSSVYMGAQSGLYHFVDGKFDKLFSTDNSPLQVASTVPATAKSYVEATALCFDSDQNLWVFNSIAPNRSLLEYTASGEWKQYDHTEFMYSSNRSLEIVENMMFDSRGLMWMVNNFFRTPCLLCYQPSTDGVKRYDTFINKEGTSYNLSYVRDVKEDKNHNIWICTNVGPFYLSPDDIANGNTLFTQVIVPRNDGSNIGDYLLSDVDVNAMAVDKANRKWFASESYGVYCISSDNMTQLYHFTTDNSPLLSNEVLSIAIDDNTGEVFFGTSNGLCSYMSDANTASDGMTKDNVWAYPNPVKPDYVGPVTIRGLVNGSTVKIVTSNGVLVNEGTVSGTEYKWYAQDLDSKRVASGVYMVEVATPEGEKGVVCKIAVVN